MNRQYGGNAYTCHPWVPYTLFAGFSSQHESPDLSVSSKKRDSPVQTPSGSPPPPVSPEKERANSRYDHHDTSQASNADPRPTGCRSRHMACLARPTTDDGVGLRIRQRRGVRQCPLSESFPSLARAFGLLFCNPGQRITPFSNPSWGG